MTDTAPDWLTRFSGRMQRVRASEVRELLKLLDQPDILSFAGGIPDPALFPTAAIRAAYDEILSDPALAAQALQYSVSEGYAPLRRWIAERMTAAGAPCETENVMITAGSQQALDLLGKLFLSKGDTVVAAKPTYLGALQAFNVYEPSYVALPSNALANPEGFDATLTDPGRRAALGYFVPDFANPTGDTLTRAQRAGLLDAAGRLDMTLIEDGAYRELRFSGQDEPMMLALDIARSGSIDAARTVFCGTFSKTLTPALRMGWVCGPRAVIDRLVMLKQGGDLHVSTINQMVVHRVLAHGYDEHLADLRTAYGKRAAAMQEALTRWAPPGVTWSNPRGGMFVWVRLPVGMDGAVLLERAIAEERIAFVPGSPFYADQPEVNTLRLNYSLPNEAQIAAGVERLGKLIARYTPLESAARRPKLAERA